MKMPEDVPESWAKDPFENKNFGSADLVVYLAFFIFASLVGIAVYSFFANGGTDTAADQTETTVDETEATADESVPESAPEATTTVPESESEPTATSGGGTAAMTEPLVGLYDNGTVVLSGAVPTDSAMASSVLAVESLFEAETVQPELVVDPNVDVPTSLTIRFTDTLLFQPGSDEITNDLTTQLDQVLAFMADHPSVTLLVEGHTDNDGDELRNLVLSQTRAESARKYLVDAGLEASRIEALGRGDTRPIATNDTSEGREQNRRIEFQVNGLQLASP